MRAMGFDCRRRSFLVKSGALAAATALPVTLSARRVRTSTDWGPLVEDPDGILDLPAEFTYRVLQTSGEDMSDGYVVPQLPDGMAAFSGPNGTVVLMRNHENTLFGGPYGFGQAPPQAYDSSAMGAVTRVVLDGTNFNVQSSNLVLCGTMRNCAGGMSPWGWLSCEESTDSNHGYVFLCATDAESVEDPVRIPAYGRFNHEAACVDPSTNICYLTEDESNSCFYRMVPDDPSDPFTGTLQALKVVGSNTYATTGMSVGEILNVEWVDIDDPEGSSSSCRSQGQSKGAAIFVRGEGIWFHEGAVYICSTSGGPVAGGQIFRLIDDPAGSTLELLGQSTDRDMLDMPDNITVAPNGQIFMAENGTRTPFIRVLTLDGQVADFARNAENSSEFCGVCFSPDGKAMFVNVQGTGRTLVITGPFDGDGDDSGSEDSGGADESGDEGDSGGGDSEDSGGEDDTGDSEESDGGDDDSGSSESGDSSADESGDEDGGGTGSDTGGTSGGETADDDTGDVGDSAGGSGDGGSVDGGGDDRGGDGDGGGTDGGGDPDEGDGLSAEGGGAGCRVAASSEASWKALFGVGLWAALTSRRRPQSSEDVPAIISEGEPDA